MTSTQVGANSLTSPLTRYSVKEYYFKAGLCQLAKGVRLLPSLKVFDIGI